MVAAKTHKSQTEPQTTGRKSAARRSLPPVQLKAPESVGNRQTALAESVLQLSQQPSAAFTLQRKTGAERTDAPAQPNPVQVKANNTGLPDTLKTGVESLSGFDMSDVSVHYNSPRPAQLQALAYAQGTDIHIAPGQERHLPHEAWHVVQQKQGRVRPTIQMKGNVPVNDDTGLEREADVMGGKAMNTKSSSGNLGTQSAVQLKGNVVQKIKLDKEVIVNGVPTFVTGKIKKTTHFHTDLNNNNDYFTEPNLGTKWLKGGKIGEALEPGDGIPRIISKIQLHKLPGNKEQSTIVNGCVPIDASYLNYTGIRFLWLKVEKIDIHNSTNGFGGNATKLSPINSFNSANQATVLPSVDPNGKFDSSALSAAPNNKGWLEWGADRAHRVYNILTENNVDQNDKAWSTWLLDNCAYISKDIFDIYFGLNPIKIADRIGKIVTEPDTGLREKLLLLTLFGTEESINYVKNNWEILLPKNFAEKKFPVEKGKEVLEQLKNLKEWYSSGRFEQEEFADFGRKSLAEMITSAAGLD